MLINVRLFAVRFHNGNCNENIRDGSGIKRLKNIQEIT